MSESDEGTKLRGNIGGTVPVGTEVRGDASEPIGTVVESHEDGTATIELNANGVALMAEYAARPGVVFMPDGKALAIGAAPGEWDRFVRDVKSRGPS